MAPSATVPQFTVVTYFVISFLIEFLQIQFCSSGLRICFNICQARARKFEIDDDRFWKDGEPFQIIGGDLHYFRVLPEVLPFAFSV